RRRRDDEPGLLEIGRLECPFEKLHAGPVQLFADFRSDHGDAGPRCKQRVELARRDAASPDEEDVAAIELQKGGEQIHGDWLLNENWNCAVQVRGSSGAVSGSRLRLARAPGSNSRGDNNTRKPEGSTSSLAGNSASGTCQATPRKGLF